jgi:predicted nuclease of restriction endonuclease-like (RecB) superfamily
LIVALIHNQQNNKEAVNTMTSIEINSKTYAGLLQNLKAEISQARIRAHLSVNREMISLYWNIGNQILERQKQEGWGTKVIENISKDLRTEFPEMKGLSFQNISYMRQFLQQAIGGIPWGHNITIFSKIKNHDERLWYAEKTIENGWSRNVMVIQIQTNLYKAHGKR